MTHPLTLAAGKRRARRPCQCWHCYRVIPAGGVYEYQTNKFDGSVYTLKYHPDCARASEWYQVYTPYDDGYPPLRDDLVESGDYHQELNAMRGRFPHVVCRMELTDQLREAAKERRLNAIRDT